MGQEVLSGWGVFALGCAISSRFFPRVSAPFFREKLRGAKLSGQRPGTLPFPRLLPGGETRTTIPRLPLLMEKAVGRGCRVGVSGCLAVFWSGPMQCSEVELNETLGVGNSDGTRNS